MASFSSASLEDVSRRQADIDNLLATRQLHFDVELGGNPAELRAVPAGAPRPGQAAFGFRGGDTRIWLSMRQDVMRVLCRPWTDQPDADGLPVELRQALMEIALGPLVAPLQDMLDLDLHLDDVGAGPPPGAVRLSLDEAREHGRRVVAEIHLNAAATERLERWLELAPERDADRAWADMPARLGLRLGHVSVSPRELGELETADVLVLPPHVDAEKPVLSVCHGERVIAAARMEDSQVMIEALTEESMSDHPPLDEDAPDAPSESQRTETTDLGDLDVRLDFDLGSVTMPFRELQKISPGYILEPDMPLDGGVRVLSGGKMIGRGELVQIGERLGVRLSELFGSHRE